MANACAMIAACGTHQQGDACYVNSTTQANEIADSPNRYERPSDQGVAGYVVLPFEST